MNQTMVAYAHWSRAALDQRGHDFHDYVHSIAEARYVIRRVLRIVDEQAKGNGLDPLQHQALLQVYGSDVDEGLAVNQLATRLDIATPHASRLASQLEALGLVRRESSVRDRRVTSVRATAEGVRRLQMVDDAVHQNVAAFHGQLDDTQRYSALSIFAFYVGMDPTLSIADTIRTSEPRGRSGAATRDPEPVVTSD